MSKTVPSYSDLLVGAAGSGKKIGPGGSLPGGPGSGRTIGAGDSLSEGFGAMGRSISSLASLSTSALANPLAGGSGAAKNAIDQWLARTADTGTPAGEDGESGDTTVFQYDETVYDTEITSSGFTSSYPAVLGIVPFKNLYSAGSLSNTGEIYKIQNEMKNSSVKRANQIVEDYFAAFPDSATYLSSLRSQNIEKYNLITSQVPDAIKARENIIYAPDITKYDADALGAVAIGSTIAATPLNPAPPEFIFEYETSDINSYDDGSSDLSVALSRRLLGLNKDSLVYDNSVQSKTARQNQLLKAALAQLSEGIRFDEDSISGLGQSSPYLDLSPGQSSATAGSFTSKVKSISSFLSSKVSPVSGFTYAKNQLDFLADTIMNSYCPPSYAGDYEDVQSYYEQRNTVFKGDVFRDSRGDYVPASTTLGLASRVTLGQSFPTYLWGSKYQRSSTSDATKTSAASGMPFFSISQMGDISEMAKFFNQAIQSLAYEIMSQTKSLPGLPSSIDPNVTSDVNISGGSTTYSGLRYTVTTDDKQAYLFDQLVKDATSINAVPITTALISSNPELTDISSQISEIDDKLDSFVSDYGHVIDPACCLTLIKTFYDEYISYFTESILAGTHTDEKSALRTAILVRAAYSPEAAGRLFRFLDDPTNNALRAVAYGSGIEIEGGEGARKALSTFLASTPSIQELAEDYIGSNGSLATFGWDFNAGDHEINLADRGQTTSVGSAGGSSLRKVNFDFLDTMEYLAGYIFETDGSLFTAQRIVDTLKSYYPVLGAVGEATSLSKKVKITAYLGLLYFIRCLNIRASLGAYPSTWDNYKSGIFNVDPAATGTLGLGDVEMRGYVRFYAEEALFLADCLKESIDVASIDDMNFDNFNSKLGKAPNDTEKNKGASLFARARAPIKYVLQASRDMIATLAYQRTVLNRQIDNIASLNAILSTISNSLEGDTDRASKILGRYLTIESVAEMMYRSQRYQKLIPGTRISAIASRSSNYRTSVLSTFRSLIPDQEDLKICIVGIPYGHLQRLRLAKDWWMLYITRYSFDVKINSDSVSDSSEPETTISYDHSYSREYFRFYESYGGGPYSAYIVELTDNFDSTTKVSSVTDDSISFDYLSGDFKSILSKSRSEATDQEKKVDVPAALVQAALQSYLEDVYGLYPRFASTKIPLQESAYPEEQYANAALNFAGISTDSTEGLLIYNRLRSVIMMHEDFMTSRMLDELEASPLFDKVVCVLVQGQNLPDTLTQIYAKVDV